MSRGPNLFLLGARVAGRLPEQVVRAVLLVGADIAWLQHGPGVRQLERNLRRAQPDADARAVRRLSRAGMRNYLRYFGEAFILGRLSNEQLLARVTPVTSADVSAELAEGRSVVLALGHQGNWDLAGAWATVHLGPVTTVAERLEPPEVFAEFVALSERLGMTIIPLDHGGDVFRELVRAVRTGAVLVPLLADRDLTARGVEVQLFGHRARVAVGPAALAVATGSQLVPVTLRHERLRGARRRAAGARWGLTVTFHDAVPVPAGSRPEQVQQMTQGWVDVLAQDIREHPTHWHMLQKVFVDDLDPDRYAATTATPGLRHPAGEETTS